MKVPQAERGPKNSNESDREPMNEVCELLPEDGDNLVNGCSSRLGDTLDKLFDLLLELVHKLGESVLQIVDGFVELLGERGNLL